MGGADRSEAAQPCHGKACPAGDEATEAEITFNSLTSGRICLNVTRVVVFYLQSMPRRVDDKEDIGGDGHSIRSVEGQGTRLHYSD